MQTDMMPIHMCAPKEAKKTALEECGWKVLGSNDGLQASERRVQHTTRDRPLHPHRGTWESRGVETESHRPLHGDSRTAISRGTCEPRARAHSLFRLLSRRSDALFFSSRSSSCCRNSFSSSARALSMLWWSKREREREKERKKEQVCVCVCVCVRERERERERRGERGTQRGQREILSNQSLYSHFIEGTLARYSGLLTSTS